MLYLISLGLNDEKDMSLRALEAAKACDFLYLELYTTRMFTNAEKLGKLIGKPVEEIQRNDMEENSGKLLEKAKTRNVGILVGGDALTATTHTSLLMDAKKADIEVRVIHGSSILTAVGSTGLQLYKFGKTVTLAFPEENYKPTSTYDGIRENQSRDLHTLILLDVKSESGKYMSVPEAAEILFRDKVFPEDTKLIACCQLGSGSETIRYATIKQLLNDTSLQNKTPAVLIVPGKLHFMEEDYLTQYS